MSDSPYKMVENALSAASSQLAVQLLGQVKYGWNGKSAGSECALNGRRLWLRVQQAPLEKFNTRIWNGEIEARKITGVSKPKLERWYDWETTNARWRASLMTMVKEKVCSETPELRNVQIVDDRWFDDLRRSLAALRRYRTDRVNTRQDLIQRRIGERFGSGASVDVHEWVTCHGDLHWANLTCPRLVILDWEGWGIGPRGLDPAMLLGFSGLNRGVSRRIRERFGQELNSRDGLISILFVCAELLRMIELHGDHPDLKPGLEGLARDSLARLTRL